MDKFATPSINLAKNRGDHLSDRILAYALTTGRVLVIITEAIALGAFLYRFGLDRQLVDLHNRINQEQAIVALLKNNETTYRNLQDRLTLEQNLSTATGKSLKLYQDISNMVPSDMALTSLYLSDTIVQVEGTVPSLVSLSSFVNKLKGYSAVDSVSLDKIENKTSEASIDVSLTIYMKKTRSIPLL